MTSRQDKIVALVDHELAPVLTSCKRRSKSAAGGGGKVQRPGHYLPRTLRGVNFLITPVATPGMFLFPL